MAFSIPHTAAAAAAAAAGLLSVETEVMFLEAWSRALPGLFFFIKMDPSSYYKL